MDLLTLDVAHDQNVNCTTEPNGSSTLVRGEAVEPIRSARPDPVALFDEVTKRWKLESEGVDIDFEACYSTSRLEHISLLQTINRYTTRAKQAPLNLDTPHDWTDVEKSAHAACDAVSNLLAEDQATNGLRSKLSKGFKTLCQHAGAGQTFVSLIPNDVFGLSSLLCGALKMIFSAMQQSDTHRTEVYKALAELPVLICDHSASCEGHKGDEQLHRRASALYASIFRLLGHIFNWYSKSTIVTGIKLVVNPNRLGERLKEGSAEVKLRAQEFRNRAMKCSLELQDQSVQLQYWSHCNQVNMRRDLEHIRASTSSIDQKLTRVELLELLDPMQQSITEKVVRRLQTNSLRLKTPKQIAKAHLTKFLEDFQYEQDLVFQDCHFFTDRLGLMNLDERSATYLTAMQCSYQMRVFLTADEPSILAVMAHCEPQPDSELSLLTAKIVQRLFLITNTRDPGAKIAKIIPLVFFCGRHRDRRRDPYANPTEVALSLLMQLIDRHRDYIGLEFLDRCRACVDPTNIQSICNALKELISTLSENVILVVIIEGLEFFAQTAHMRDPAKHLFLTLVSTYRSNLEAMMKCLFLSSSRLDFVGNVLEDEEILEMSMNSHHNGHYPDWLRHEPLQIGFD